MNMVGCIDVYFSALMFLLAFELSILLIIRVFHVLKFIDVRKFVVTQLIVWVSLVVALTLMFIGYAIFR